MKEQTRQITKKPVNEEHAFLSWILLNIVQPSVIQLDCKISTEVIDCSRFGLVFAYI